MCVIEDPEPNGEAVQDLMMELDYWSLHVHIEICVCVCVCVCVCMCVFCVWVGPYV